MKTAMLWLEAARPKTLVLSIMPVLIGASFAARQGTFSLLACLMTFLTALLIQMGANFANDYYDFLKGADTAERKGPRRLTQAGLISLSQMKLAIFLTFSAVALMSIYLSARGGPVFTLLTTLSIAFGILYTGGPKPLAYLGLGEVFVFLFFGPISTAGAAYLQTLTFSWEAVLLGLTPGFLASAVLVMNNLRDINEDKKADKKTLTVRFGKKFTQVEYTVLICLGCLLPLTMGWWLSAFALIPAIIPLKTVWRHIHVGELNAALAQTAQVGLLTAALLAFGLLAHAV
ncbi:MAG: 1,4-dihydroxy-2-naphthoate polyprenyltransferase [Rhabdochlamydiaceae bacterium]|nr:1,4-dihydroxy-2-naphthoate polyprenyltransferase [Rhabdochlamydiaceae bacterium]